jgi:hypothetical protein
MSITNTFWHFADENARQQLGGDPLSLLADAETVKTNAVRKVFRNDGIFLKLDRRARSSFKGEFNAARLCASRGIGTVEHLAWGRSSEGAWLVTRAAEGFTEAASLFQSRQKSELYEKLAVFLRGLLTSDVYHPDLHLGNVLIDPENGLCRLVDLHGVRRKNFFDIFKFYMMQRCIMELRNTCSDAEMIRLAESCGIRNPEGFFRKALIREAVLLEALLPKRRRQILNGYFKYTRCESCGCLVDVNVEEESLKDSEVLSVPDGEEIFLFHFFLTQAKIPHRRVCAFDPVSKQIRIEKELPGKYRSHAAAGELVRRLACHRIQCCESAFCNGFLHDTIGVSRNNRRRV